MRKYYIPIGLAIMWAFILSGCSKSVTTREWRACLQEKEESECEVPSGFPQYMFPQELLK